MTIKEAITAVEEVTGMSLPWDDRHYEALQMAIEALNLFAGVDKKVSVERQEGDLITSAQPDVPDIYAGDMIYRQAAVDAIDALHDKPNAWLDSAVDAVMKLPSAQPERDIPIKPIETTDKAWGIPHRQAVCPRCDYYLGHVAFLGDYKGKRITYCETCGQAIDWEGWDFDE